MTTSSEVVIPGYMIEREPGTHFPSAYQSISFHPQLRHLSVEELRWSWYSVSSNGILAAESSVAGPITTPGLFSQKPLVTAANNATAQPTSLFGNPSSKTGGGGLFGGKAETTAQPVSARSLFGNPNAAAMSNNSPSLFASFGKPTGTLFGSAVGNTTQPAPASGLFSQDSNKTTSNNFTPQNSQLLGGTVSYDGSLFGGGQLFGTGPLFTRGTANSTHPGATNSLFSPNPAASKNTTTQPTSLFAALEGANASTTQTKPLFGFSRDPNTATSNNTATPSISLPGGTVSSNQPLLGGIDSTAIFKPPSVRDAPENHYTLGDDFITFLVGPAPGQKFTIHEGVLETSSECIRRALDVESNKDTKRAIPLPNEEPAVFSIYQSWLYTSMLLTRSDEDESGTDPEYQLLVKAYILGEKIIDQDFRDCIADALVEKFDALYSLNASFADLERFDTSLTGLVFKGEPAGSPLRKLWLDFYFHFGKEEWLNSESAKGSPDPQFLLEFSRLSMQKNRSLLSSAWKGGRLGDCTYHGHGDAPCYRDRY